MGIIMWISMHCKHMCIDSVQEKWYIWVKCFHFKFYKCLVYLQWNYHSLEHEYTSFVHSTIVDLKMARCCYKSTEVYFIHEICWFLFLRQARLGCEKSVQILVSFSNDTVNLCVNFCQVSCAQISQYNSNNDMVITIFCLYVNC